MDRWQIVETAFDPDAQHHRETLFTIGNGYLGTRGTFEEGYPGEHALTLIHALFDDVPLFNTELVNAPHWPHLHLTFDGEPFRLDRGDVLTYRRTLDLRHGLLRRTVRWRTPTGHTVELHFERFASLDAPHLAGVRLRLTSVNFAGRVEIRAGLPGHGDNAGWFHWTPEDRGVLDAQSVYLLLRTRATHIPLCAAAHLAVTDAPTSVHYTPWPCDWSPAVVARLTLKPGQSLTARKLVAIYTGVDTPDPREAALRELRAALARGYAALRAAHDAAWADAWQASDLTIEGDDEADIAVRYSTFQLLIAAPRTPELAGRTSIAAKTLSGLGYRGHIFWDTEIFMLPLFTYTQPTLARHMLRYRHHTLPAARRKAQAHGWEGAMFAWESAATGEEVTPTWLPGLDGELIRIWCGDIEQHITADVAHAVDHYWRVTGDDAFMRDYGAEIILDTARFWGSRATWNAQRRAYEINDVIGPDENHEHVNNNAYTNHLARWNLRAALRTWAWLRQTAPAKAAELGARLDLTETRLRRWREIIAHIALNTDPQTHLIEQFDGFFGLKPLDLAAYEPRTTSIQGLLGVEATQRYQVLKQPDVLMLLYLLGDEYDLETLRANWNYYTPITDLTYGSSLGPAIHAALAARLGDVETAYRDFRLAAGTDLHDVRGNAGDGIHGATAGGLWQAVIFGFGGVHLTDAGPVAAPHLPPHWSRLTFRLRYHGQSHTFDLHP